MKKNGFVFIESIVTIALLTASLLVLYSSFSKVMQTNKKRQNYDDIKYVYRADYIKRTLDLINIQNVLNDFSNSSSHYIYLGSNTPNIYNYQNAFKINFLNSELDAFDVQYMFLLKKNSLEQIKNCNADCSNQYELSDELINYLKNININIDSTYILIVVFESCNQNKCYNYYSWVSVN